jgi:hypothetical protein
MRGSQNKRGRFIRAFAWLLPLVVFSFDLQAFVLISNGGKVARWPNGRVEYYYKDVSNPRKSAIEASFDAWFEVSGIDLSFVAKGNSATSQSRDGRNVLSFVSENWTSLSFRPPTNALAVTLSSFNTQSGDIVDADIYFNADYFEWGNVESEEDMDFVDVQNIATHEIGHMIGIDHSSVNYFETDNELAEATMFYASGSGETSRREPKADDIRAVRALYSDSALPQATISEVEEIDRVGRTVLYRVRGTNFNDLTSFIMASESFSMGDIVSRYKTILSSTEAEVEFNLAGFFDLTPQFVVLNAAGDPDAIAFELDASLLGPNSISASEDSGGGGCSARHNSRSVDFVWILFLALILGLKFKPVFLRATRRRR